MLFLPTILVGFVLSLRCDPSWTRQECNVRKLMYNQKVLKSSRFRSIKPHKTISTMEGKFGHSAHHLRHEIMGKETGLIIR